MAHQAGVKVKEFYYVSRISKVHHGGEGQPAFQHAAKHAGDLMGIGHFAYFKRLMNSARFCQLDVNIIKMTFAGHSLRIGGYITTFIGHQWNSEFFKFAHSEIVMHPQWLLTKLDVVVLNRV